MRAVLLGRPHRKHDNPIRGNSFPNLGPSQFFIVIFRHAETLCYLGAQFQTMKLDELIAKKRTLSISELSDDKDLSKDVQKQLARLGVLDPPADGDFGPVSMLAGREFFARAHSEAGTPPTLDWKLAVRLVESKPDEILPVTPGANLAGAIWQAMTANKYFLTRVPGWINIVYLEGANADGTPNDNRPNRFNDLRLVLTVENGKPAIVGKWEATTEPGKFYTDNPMNPTGAARIALDQFKAWCVGTHGSGAGAHEALVLRGTIRVHRDLNRDFRRDGDAVDTGSSFAVNQHWGYNLPIEDIGRASAGCLVGRTKEGHRKFMDLLKSDPRYQANNGYRFMTTVLTAADVQPYL